MLYRRVGHGAPRSVNLPVLSPRVAAGEIARMLAFRYWIGTHDDDRDRYAAAKRELATRNGKYVQDYADTKTEIVEEILARALC